MGLRGKALPAQMKTIRLSLGLSLRELEIVIFNETQQRCSYSTLSRIERGLAKPPVWLLTWMHRYTPRSRPDYKGLSIRTATHARADALRRKWGLTWDGLLVWLLRGRD